MLYSFSTLYFVVKKERISDRFSAFYALPCISDFASRRFFGNVVINIRTTTPPQLKLKPRKQARIFTNKYILKYTL